MHTTNSHLRLVLAGTLLTLGFVVLLPGDASSQDDPVADSIKESEAFKAMEAAADSARKAAARGRGNAAPAQTTTTPAQVSDSADVVASPTDTLKFDVPKQADTTAKTADTPAAKVDTSDVKSATSPGDTTVKQAAAPPAKPVDPTAPYKDVQFAPSEKPRVVIETTMGKIVLELWPDVAKKHCQNFVYQVTQGFYDSLTFHRIVPGFIIQGGDPDGAGTGGPGYTVPAELSAKQLHEEGTLSMARRVDPAAKSGEAEKPEYLNSAGSQFFICLARAASLDGKYTVFGKVVEGLDVIHAIEKLPTQRERPVAPVYMTKVSLEPKA